MSVSLRTLALVFARRVGQLLGLALGLTLQQATDPVLDLVRIDPAPRCACRRRSSRTRRAPEMVAKATLPAASFCS